MPLRYLWVDDHDEVRLLPTIRFQRIWEGEIAVPEFAGQRVRFVEAAIETRNRKPVALLRIIYFFLSFGNQGFLDAEVREREGFESVIALSPLLEPKGEGNLLTSGGRFERKRFEYEFRWNPSSKLESRIMSRVLK